MGPTKSLTFTPGDLRVVMLFVGCVFLVFARYFGIPGSCELFSLSGVYIQCYFP